LELLADKTSILESLMPLKWLFRGQGTRKQQRCSVTGISSRGLQSYLSSVLFHSTEKIKERGAEYSPFVIDLKVQQGSEVLK
jgi:hypothetical protein